MTVHAELAGIKAAGRDLTAASHRFGVRCAGRAARLIRVEYPTAAAIVFGVTSSGGDETLTPLHLRAADGTLLWNDDTDRRPDVLDQHGDVVDLLCDIYNHGAAGTTAEPDDDDYADGDGNPHRDVDADVRQLDLREALVDLEADIDAENADYERTTTAAHRPRVYGPAQVGAIQIADHAIVVGPTADHTGTALVIEGSIRELRDYTLTILAGILRREPEGGSTLMRDVLAKMAEQDALACQVVDIFGAVPASTDD